HESRVARLGPRACAQHGHGDRRRHAGRSPGESGGDRSLSGQSRMNILELANVEASYGPVQALRGVTLSVEEHKIVTVLGANGAGKSTILKTISGIIDPQKGQIRFGGAEIQARDPDWIVRQGIGHVPEGREVFPLLTVDENLRMGAYTRSDAEGIARDLQM